jgi:hypothetical protein
MRIILQAEHILACNQYIYIYYPAGCTVLTCRLYTYCPAGSIHYPAGRTHINQQAVHVFSCRLYTYYPAGCTHINQQQYTYYPAGSKHIILQAVHILSCRQHTCYPAGNTRCSIYKLFFMKCKTSV